MLVPAAPTAGHNDGVQTRDRTVDREGAAGGKGVNRVIATGRHRTARRQGGGRHGLGESRDMRHRALGIGDRELTRRRRLHPDRLPGRTVNDIGIAGRTFQLGRGVTLDPVAAASVIHQIEEPLGGPHLPQRLVGRPIPDHFDFPVVARHRIIQAAARGEPAAQILFLEDQPAGAAAVAQQARPHLPGDRLARLDAAEGADQRRLIVGDRAQLDQVIVAVPAAARIVVGDRRRLVIHQQHVAGGRDVAQPVFPRAARLEINRVLLAGPQPGGRDQRFGGRVVGRLGEGGRAGLIVDGHEAVAHARDPEGKTDPLGVGHRSDGQQPAGHQQTEGKKDLLHGKKCRGSVLLLPGERGAHRLGPAVAHGRRGEDFQGAGAGWDAWDGSARRSTG